MVGLCYLPQSIGGIIGGLSAGVYLRYWFNKAVHQYNNEKMNGTGTDQEEEEEEEKQDKKNKTLLIINDKSKNLPYDFPICQSRLVPVWIHGILVQVITALYGWCYVWHAPLPVLLCLQFFVGINIPIVDSAISTLTMDFRPKQAASAIASSNLFNQGFGAIASLVIYPIIQAIGVGYAFTIASLLLIVIGNLLMILLLKYGSTWREACDKNEK
ncbi:hypothetical protein INT45_011228 [Circinella minor]|uniref:Major facilitator superfamily (MFS) profile domain-containing protein n=1 Tax=Circinella minor TaxID=1195481 RepID=A0A8H7VJE3_9FUNG|nr:hypothetical protein INT45_011228 [Circinella minor]